MVRIVSTIRSWTPAQSPPKAGGSAFFAGLTKPPEPGRRPRRSASVDRRRPWSGPARWSGPSALCPASGSVDDTAFLRRGENGIEVVRRGNALAFLADHQQTFRRLFDEARVRRGHSLQEFGKEPAGRRRSRGEGARPPTVAVRPTRSRQRRYPPVRRTSHHGHTNPTARRNSTQLEVIAKLELSGNWRRSGRPLAIVGDVRAAWSLQRGVPGRRRRVRTDPAIDNRARAKRALHAVHERPSVQCRRPRSPRSGHP